MGGRQGARDRVPTIWFHLYEGQEQVKLTCSDSDQSGQILGASIAWEGAHGAL